MVRPHPFCIQNVLKTYHFPDLNRERARNQFVPHPNLLPEGEGMAVASDCRFASHWS
jgi:hypothetical protein